uniref:Toxin CcdB n=1 Tax=uncultured Thiotrichaceae bacterium TaxID=298394 RepID=A0A6S6U7X0_9GAMM|nr:MAG: Plasmid maintenance protein CcdB [uncultured Thiotrichaceae bacterium]
MAQFDVYHNINPATQEQIPYLLDVQTDLINVVQTRVVVPLEICGSFAPAARLSPVFQIEGVTVAMSTPELAGVHLRSLGDFVCSLSEKRQEIMGALDLLFSGI